MANCCHGCFNKVRITLQESIAGATSVDLAVVKVEKLHEVQVSFDH